MKKLLREESSNTCECFSSSNTNQVVFVFVQGGLKKKKDEEISLKFGDYCIAFLSYKYMVHLATKVNRLCSRTSFH